MSDTVHSKKEGGKKERKRDAGELDPAVEHVQQQLESNLTYFMSNIGATIKRYNQLLEAALPGNPKAKGQSERASPLLKRPSSIEIASTENKEAQPPALAPLPPPAIPSNATKAVKPLGENEEEIHVVFPNNTELRKQLHFLKREAYELSVTFDGIHDWIALNIPDMKDEDNTGVEVMGAVIEQCSTLNDAIRGVYGLELKYLSERGEIEKAMLKCPESVSLKLQLEVSDGDTWDELERGWRILTRSCLILYSVLSKNMQKLREPRQQRHHAAYI